MTAHVARKGEPDDKTNIAKSNRSTNSNQNCMKQEVKNIGNTETVVTTNLLQQN